MRKTGKNNDNNSSIFLIAIAREKDEKKTKRKQNDPRIADIWQTVIEIERDLYRRRGTIRNSKRVCQVRARCRKSPSPPPLPLSRRRRRGNHDRRPIESDAFMHRARPMIPMSPHAINDDYIPLPTRTRAANGFSYVELPPRPLPHLDLRSLGIDST